MNTRVEVQQLKFSVEGSLDQVDPAKLVALALSYGFSAEVSELPPELNSEEKVLIVFTAIRATRNPVKALDDAIELICEAQDQMNRKDLIEQAEKQGSEAW